MRVALALAFVAMLASAPGQSFLISVFVDDMLAGTGLSRTVFSALYAAATVVSATLSLLVGRASDRIGLRVAWIGVALGLAAACLIASVAAGLVVAFVALALLRSFGQGSFPLVGTLVVAHSFHRRRGQAMALAGFGITAGMIALPPLVALLIDGVGWRSAYRLIALVVVALILPLGLLLRGSEPAREAAAALPDVPYPPAIRRSRRLRVRVPTADAARLLLVFAAPPLVMTAIVFHAVSLLGLRGISAPQAAAALSVFGLANAAGTLAAGAVADRLSTRALLSAMSGVLLAGALVVLAPDAVTSYAGFALVGFSGGVFGVASGITWARTYGLVAIGSLQGMSVAAQIAAAAAGPLPLAFSLQLSGSYVPGLVLLVAVGAVALAGALGWREPQSRSATV